MCRAILDLASGNFDVVLPGLGREDELGEMAGAVEEFKRQAIAKAEHDAAAQDGQAREASAARRAELIRFADNFEAAVGSIVSNVSASAGQLEQAAGTLTQTAETTQSLSEPGCGQLRGGLDQDRIGRSGDRTASVAEIGGHFVEAAILAHGNYSTVISSPSYASRMCGGSMLSAPT